MAYQSVYQNQKKLRKLIIELRKEGISNQAIFEMLAPDYRDKNAIAAIIAGTPTSARMQQYLPFTYVKIGIASIMAIIIAIGIQHTVANHIFSNKTMVVYGIFQVIIFAGLIIGIWLTRKTLTNSTPFFMLLTLYNYGKVLDFSDSLFITYIVLMLVLMIVTIIHRKKLCPNISYGQAKKLKDGTYILGD
jgi:hypothetical protein